MCKEIIYVLLSKKVQITDRIISDRIVKHKYIDYKPKISNILNDDDVYSEIYDHVKDYIDSNYYIYILFKNDRANKFKACFNEAKSKLEFIGVEYNTQKLLNAYKPILRLNKLNKI
jgi:hypothetical protein